MKPVRYDLLSQPERRTIRENYVRAQEGLCHHCKAPLSGEPAESISKLSIDWRRFPGGRKFLRHPVHLHHSHKTNLTIGAVHAYYNAALWQYHGE